MTRLQKPKTQHARIPDEGFTIIEVMVALVIFAFGILAVLSMQTTAIRGGHQSNNLSEAARIGANAIEQFVIQDYADVSNGDDTANGKYSLKWVVTETTSGQLANTKAIDLTVQWIEGGRTHTVSYEFLKAKDI